MRLGLVMSQPSFFTANKNKMKQTHWIPAGLFVIFYWATMVLNSVRVAGRVFMTDSDWAAIICHYCIVFTSILYVAIECIHTVDYITHSIFITACICCVTVLYFLCICRVTWLYFVSSAPYFPVTAEMAKLPRSCFKLPSLYC